MSMRKEFVNQLKTQIDLLNKQVDEIEVKMKSASTDLKGRMEGQLDELRGRRKQAEEMVGKVTAAGESGFEALKQQAIKTQKALEQSVHYFMSQMK